MSSRFISPLSLGKVSTVPDIAVSRRRVFCHQNAVEHALKLGNAPKSVPIASLPVNLLASESPESASHWRRGATQTDKQMLEVLSVGKTDFFCAFLLAPFAINLISSPPIPLSLVRE